ncbi:MAG: dihydrodipicolinate synthase family protein [Phycisphaerales bacterium]|nr:dihydrodipicolinate synthase family protein [Phycisphaerales bacterium]
MHRFEGLVAAAHSPMAPDGSVATGVVPLQAALHREQENVGVFICGSTGEGHSLTREERQELAEAWSSVVDQELRLIVHVGCNALPDARALAEHAGSVGASAISCQAPCYERPRTVDELVRFIVEVAGAAPDLPFYYYDIPSFTHVDFPIVDVMEQAGRLLPNLQGVKFTVDDPDAEAACLEMQGGRFEVLHGCDERLLDGLRLGCTGAVGSTYNYAAPVYRNLIDLMEIGDEIGASAAQEQAVRLVEVLLRFGVLRAGKAIMGMLGVDCGPPRLPSTPLSEAEAGELASLLDGMDIFPRALS